MGYNTTDGVGFIQPVHWGIEFKPLVLCPNGGRVGIGTTSPSTALHVSAADTELRVQSTTSANGYIRFLNTSGSMSIGMSGASSNSLLFYDRSNNHSVYNYDGGAGGSHVWYQNNSEAARIDSSGRLLVGTSTARSNFFGTTLSAVTQVEGTGGATGRGALSVINNDVSNNPPYVLLGRSGAATLGSNAVVVSGSRLGTLTFHGADGTSFIEAATVAGEVDGTPGTNDMPGRLVFSTTADGASSPTERMRIDSAGAFKTSANGTYKFPLGTTEITHNDATSSVQLIASNTSFTGDAVTISTYRNTVNDTYKFLACVRQGAAVALEIRDDGDVYNANGTYGSLSDVKLKENIVDAQSQWNDIKQLRVRNYNFKPETNNSTHKQIGVIAQELETVSPGLVNTVSDRDEDGNDLGTTTKSVNYSVLYMKAVKALQEAMERIETLEAKVAALEAQ
jgi:hypothetical protein